MNIREGEIVYRREPLKQPGENETIPRATLSTDTPVRGFFGDEILEHSEDAINLERAAADGLPLLVEHGAGGPLPVGRVHNVRLEDGRLRGDPVLSESTALAREARSLIGEGVLTDLSIGARVDAPPTVDESGERPVLRISRWTPLEASLTAVGADDRAGIGRNLKGAIMTDPTPKPKPHAVPDDADTVERAAISEIYRSTQHLIDAVPQLADRAREIRDKHVTGKANPEIARKELFALLAEDTSTFAVHDGHVQRGADGLDKFAAAATEALCIRSMLTGYGHEQAMQNEFASYSMVELARSWAQRAGVDTRGMSRTDLVGHVFTRAVDGPAANTTATYPAILENVLNKSLFQGFEEHPRTWDVWCKTGSNADYKQFTRPGLSHFQDLVAVAENAAYQEGTFVDKKEQGVIGKYGRVYSITREAIVNDDLGAFSSTGPAMGEAAARLVNSLPYAILVNNPLMTEDGVALFAAGHNNTGTANLSEQAINDMKTAMIRQTDQNGIRVKPVLTYLIVPPELSSTLEKLLNDQQIPVAVGSGAAREHNTVAGRYTMVEEADLTDPNDWYGASRKGQTIEMVFLDGRTTPTLEREAGFTVDALHWKVRMDAVALALDFRGLAREAPV